MMKITFEIFISLLGHALIATRDAWKIAYEAFEIGRNMHLCVASFDKFSTIAIDHIQL